MGVVEVEGLWLKWVQWRWVWLYAYMLARVSGEAQAFEAETACGGGGVGREYGSLCVVLMVGVCNLLWWRRKRREEKKEERKEIGATLPSLRKSPRTLSGVGSLRKYRLKEILDITNVFKRKLGSGGQGEVYFAVLPEGRGTAAVKRLRKTVECEQRKVGGEKESQETEFWAELLTISRLHHCNLVALLGYCVEEEHLFLVYEFMAEGSLSQHLHPCTPEDGEGIVLDWAARMRCAVEVAVALLYLHSHAKPPLVHRDIKSENILFDDEMNAKIADFGLSKSVISGEEPTISKHVRGTPGYVDPVYLRNGQPCVQNDVYSYGVVLLELITGRRVIDQKFSLLKWCKPFLHTEEHEMRRILPSVVDSRMDPLDLNLVQVFEVFKIARNCVQERQEKRPSMQEVVFGLHNANCKDIFTSSEHPTIEVPSNSFSRSGGCTDSFNNTTLLGNCTPSYDIKERSIRVICTVAGSRIVLRCKIWPTWQHFGMNKVEARLDGKILWTKWLWWYNAKSSCDFTVGDDVKVTAEWHVTLRWGRTTLGSNDPRRRLGPFCIQYLALKDESGKPLVDYKGDKSPLQEMVKSPF